MYTYTFLPDVVCLSVSLSSVIFVHPDYNLRSLTDLDAVLADTLANSVTHQCVTYTVLRVSSTQRRENLRGKPQAKHATAIAAATLQVKTEQFRILSDYFSACCYTLFYMAI